MGWSLGFDPRWKRWVGYGVPAKCDHPGCDADIDRGLSYVCGGQPYGGDGCGLYFCSEHLHYSKKFENASVCKRCLTGKAPFDPSADLPEWTNHIMTHPSWKQWREENGHPEPSPDNHDNHDPQ